MARRSLTLLLLPLLAACATTPPPPATTPDDPVYLQGVSSRFSVRIDELRPERATHREKTLPNAVVAGDETLTVAASLFRHGDHFTMDMVITNHTDSPFRLHRNSIQLLDDAGQRLVAETDWEGAARYGLRARTTPRRDFPSHSEIDVTATSVRTQGGTVGNEPLKPVPAPGGEAVTTTTEVPTDYAWVASMGSDPSVPQAPEILDVKGQGNEPYWAYWKAQKVTYPLTAIVTVNNRRLLFKFDEPH